MRLPVSNVRATRHQTGGLGEILLDPDPTGGDAVVKLNHHLLYERTIATLGIQIGSKLRGGG
jgi:hypothetical protein